MLLCKLCRQALYSRGEETIVRKVIEQDIDYDEKQGKWVQIYDEDEPIKACEWCEEIDITLYDCE